MLSAATSQEAPRRSRGDRSPERRCLVSRESLPADRMIRFVVAPDGELVADTEGRLPGRGLWLRASRDIVDAACAGRVFAKAARRPVMVGDALAERVEAQLRRRCLELVGLARRAGAAIAGYEKVKASLADGKPALLLVASDAGTDGRRTSRADVPVVDLFTGAELGAVFGRERAVHVAILPGGLARRLLIETRRLAGFRPDKG